MIDVFHPPTVKYFLNWGGELKYLQNMKIARITKQNILKMVENEENGNNDMADIEEPSEKVDTKAPSENVVTDPTPPTEESTTEMETS